MKITFDITTDGKLVCPYQDEMENLALEKLDDQCNIYFDPIPINDKVDVIWTDKYKGWLLRFLLET